MEKKRLAGIIIAAAAVLIAGSLICKNSKGGAPEGYLQDKSDGISLKDAMASMKEVQFDDGKTAREYFSKSAVNRNTVGYFKFLQMKFAEFDTIEAHLEAVRNYLYSVMGRDEADRLFAVYQKYVDYEQKLTKMMSQWSYPKNAEEALAFMKKIQDYRIETFGKDVADAMFAHEFKLREYHIRKKDIIDQPGLYAADKKKMLAGLDKDMWGSDSEEYLSELRPYERYQEAQRIYSRDLSEMNSERQTAAQRKLREEIFPSDVVEKFEEIDIMMAEEKKREDNYLKEEQKILNDINLKPEEKQAKITQLQNSTFGEEADSFRARQAIEQGRIELEQKLKK